MSLVEMAGVPATKLVRCCEFVRDCFEAVCLAQTKYFTSRGIKE